MKGPVFYPAVCVTVDDDGDATLEVMWPDRRLTLILSPSQEGDEAKYCWIYGLKEPGPGDPRFLDGVDLASMVPAMHEIARWQVEHDEHLTPEERALALAKARGSRAAAMAAIDRGDDARQTTRGILARPAVGAARRAAEVDAEEVTSTLGKPPKPDRCDWWSDDGRRAVVDGRPCCWVERAWERTVARAYGVVVPDDGEPRDGGAWRADDVSSSAVETMRRWAEAERTRAEMAEARLGAALVVDEGIEHA